MQIRSFTQIQWRHYQKSDAVEPREKKNKTKQNNNKKKTENAVNTRMQWWNASL